MDWLDKKVVKTALRLVLLAALVVVAYLSYSYYEKENLSIYQMQRQDPYTAPADSIRLAQMQASADRQMDSMRMASLANKDSQSSFDVHINPSLKQNDSSVSLLSAVQERNHDDSHDTKNGETTNTLQGPSAFFSRTYTIAVGKTIPVAILWSNAGAAPVNYRLVTIKADDIANNKAMFTIEDPFAVLLFSRTGYGVNDKIMIKDERHDINISVLEIHSNVVTIQVASHLNEDIVSKLQKVK